MKGETDYQRLKRVRLSGKLKRFEMIMETELLNALHKRAKTDGCTAAHIIRQLTSEYLSSNVDN